MRINTINKALLQAITYSSLLTAPFVQAAPLQDNTQAAKPRIIGGTNAVKGDWPFMVAIMSSSATTNSPFCGASYIGGDLVLTAAHCVERTNAEDIKVALGLHQLSINSANTQHIAVKNIYTHERYNQPYRNNNDIAVLQLERTPTNIQAVELATLPETNQLIAGDLLTVMGWGTTVAGTSNHPDTLKQVDVPFVPLASCQNAGSGYSEVGDDAICAGFEYSGYDSCQGDSGGPLVKTINGKTKQFGVVSWGNGCAIAGQYGVYAKAAHFDDWINTRKNGISYTQYYNQGYQLKGNHSHTFSVENNATTPLQILSLATSTSNISDAVISDDNCSVNASQTGYVAPGEQCQVTVDYTTRLSGEASLSLTFTTNSANEPQFTTTMNVETLIAAFEGADLSAVTNLTEWMSNDYPWIKTQDSSMSYNPTVLRSNTNIFNMEESLTAVNIEGKGSLTFDYRVSSEIDFDYFYVIVNGAIQLFDSGVQTKYTSVSLPLTHDKSTILFVYYKDVAMQDGEDAAFLKNIKFTPGESNSGKTAGSSSSGGHTGLLALIALFTIALRRQSTRKVSA